MSYSLTVLERQCGENTLRAAVQGRYVQQVEFLLSLLEDRQDHLHDGYVMHLDWGPIFLEQFEGSLTLRSPNYAGDVCNERSSDLSGAIEMQISQKWLPEACGLQAQRFDFCQKIFLEKGWRGFDSFTLMRIPAQKGRCSGWLVCSPRHRLDRQFTSDEIEGKFAWQVVQRHSILAQVLLLPEGTVAVIAHGQVEVVFGMYPDGHVYYSRASRRPRRWLQGLADRSAQLRRAVRRRAP